jgi:Tfp pilus assembly PilM family ATPase
MGLSSYLLLVGIYSSAISVAEDSKLRQTIRKLGVKEAKFLASVGTAQMEDELQRRVMKLAKEQHEVLAQQTGVEPSLDEDELKQYLNETIQEIKRSSIRH